ncbi:reductive dehalogenase [Dehalococcoides mccartyi]|uniref:reductive dehalogenase n=1 Tax=Dehalococcoides mccartyi TaxID=61435 RepID=UPI0015E7D4F6|nr:reductive dehalogenase [Dehalococcoides mccartyi]MBA2084245.1 reductive dehalogenase [Dehalococcoides mccartyi]
MSKLHSTLSRRDFMKGLGLAGAGLGAVAATTPVFHDMDELTSSGTKARYPWWVKERDYFDTVCRIDWDMLERGSSEVMQSIFDENGNNIGTLAGAYYGENQKVGVSAGDPPLAGTTVSVGQDKLMEYDAMYVDYARSKYSDYEYPLLKDQALAAAVTTRTYKYQHPLWGGTECFLGTRFSPTPQDLGVPKWEATPEENLKMIRAAFRYFGASEVSVTELTEQTKKLIFLDQRSQKPGHQYHKILAAKAGFPKGLPFQKLVFEDIDDAYVTSDQTKCAIPNKCKWVINYSVQQAPQTTKRFNPLQNAGTNMGYQEAAIIENRIQEFLWSLGYQGLEGGTAAISPSGAFSTLGGNGEPCRMGMCQLSPLHGNMTRAQNTMITDLPLEVTKPIDFGAMRFCRTCKLCAQNCVYEALSLETEPTWDVTGYWNNPGYEGYRINAFKCVRCGACMAACPFGSFSVSHASVHPLVQLVSSETPIFNSFFRGMADVFGFDKIQKTETWWDSEQPIRGIDTSIGIH